MSNRLAHESSPYLLQHADNPVDWYPWGADAFERAKGENKPILLSIGYAACHWCHVMAHESFEDEATAVFMNEHFINVKVDREERPDVDKIYMDAVVAMTGQGGWPMTVALTPDGEPFFGGTYYPLQPRYGMPSFRQVLAGLVNAWQTKRGEVVAQAEAIVEHLQRRTSLAGRPGNVDAGLLERAFRTLGTSFDAQWGGFGGAPKFPSSMVLEFLLRYYRRTGDDHARHMVEFSLQKMANGGIYDHIGGGFARYSVDNEWLVPHFEKMLYDNALLARVYLHAFQLTGDRRYRQVVEETLDWVLAEMTHGAGGFYSSLDADSEGEEGKFYVWTPEEIRAVLDPDTAKIVIAYYDVSIGGNFEGKNILNTPNRMAEVAKALGQTEAAVAAAVAAARPLLYETRSQRVWPGLDDKVLTSWNGLMLAAMAEAGRVLGRADYTAAAIANARFLRDTMRRENGRLFHTWKAGTEAKVNGFLQDYAFLADGLLALYQTTFDESWYAWADELTGLILAHFQDETEGGFWDTSDDHEALVQRPKEVQDNAIPSGNAVAAHILLHLSLYSGNGDYWDLAQGAIAAMYGAMAQYPTGFGHWLSAAEFIVGEPREVAVVGDLDAAATRQLLDVIDGAYRPALVVAAAPPDASDIPLLAQRPLKDGQPAAYVCRRFLCRAPVTTPAALAVELDDDATAKNA